MSRRRLEDLAGADPYTLLRIGPEATSADIHKAHRRMIRQTHPDTAAGGEELTKLLNIARDVLLDPDLRASYDRGLRGVEPEPAPPPSAWDAEDIVVDSAPPPYVPPPPPRPPHQRTHPHPIYQQPVRPAPAPGSSGLGLGVIALIVVWLCSPVGVVLGIVALTKTPAHDKTNRICALIAIVWGTVSAMCCAGYLLLGMNSLSGPSVGAGW